MDEEYGEKMKQKQTQNSGSYRVNSILRSIKVLERIVSSEETITFAEIARDSGIPKTTLFRILSTLGREKWIEKRGQGYMPGYRLIQLGMRALSKIELRDVAAPFLRDLSMQTEETAHLVTLFGRYCLITEVCDGPKHIKIACRPGTMTELYCSAPGKVFLAFTIGADNLRAFYRDVSLKKRTGKTITSIGALAEEVTRVAEQGYAVDDTEYYEDVRCIAAPVRDAMGRTIAAVGITAPVLSLKKDSVKPTAAEVMKTGDLISRALGGRAGPDA